MVWLEPQVTPNYSCQERFVDHVFNTYHVVLKEYQVQGEVSPGAGQANFASIGF